LDDKKNKTEVKELRPSRTYYDCPLCPGKGTVEAKILKGHDRKPDDDVDSVEIEQKVGNCGIKECGKQVNKY